MAYEIIHKIIFFKTTDSKFVPLFLINRSDEQKHSLPTWVIMHKLGLKEQIEYTRNEIYEIISAYKADKNKACFVYKGKWKSGKKLADLIEDAFCNSFFIEEIQSNCFPIVTLVVSFDGKERRGKMILSSSENLSAFLSIYNSLKYVKGITNVLPLIAFTVNTPLKYSKKERSRNFVKNEIEKRYEGLYVAQIYEKESCLRFVENIGKHGLEITTDEYAALVFSSAESINQYAQDMNIEADYGIIIVPYKIRKRYDSEALLLGLQKSDLLPDAFADILENV